LGWYRENPRKPPIFSHHKEKKRKEKEKEKRGEEIRETPEF
jgi:hypothetical protein